MRTTDTFFHICRRILRNMFSLSPAAITSLIHAMLGSNHPVDNTVTNTITYERTTPIGRNSNQLVDMMVTINSADCYRIQAQMTSDEDILLQVSETAHNHTLRNPIAVSSFLFSELDFSELPTGEIKHRNMVCLIPFSLLSLRRAIEEERSPQNLEALKTLIQNDIVCTIDENLQFGNITVDDACKLRTYTHILYQHLYSRYNEMTELNNMADGLFLTDTTLLPFLSK